MRIVFWGNDTRGATCLEALVRAGFNVALVVVHEVSTSRDGPTVEAKAQEFNLPVLRAMNFTSDEFHEALAKSDPDLFVLAGFGKILKQNHLSIPKIGTINLHGGSVPEYRGSSITRWAIINGATRVGVSILEVDEDIDTGKVLASAVFDFTLDGRPVELIKLQNDAFPQLLISTLRKIDEEQRIDGIPQSEHGSYWHALKSADGLLRFAEWSALKCERWARAFSHPYSGAFFRLGSDDIFVERVSVSKYEVRGIPGRVARVRDEGALVVTSNGGLLIESLLIEGRIEHPRTILRPGMTLNESVK